MEVNRKHFPVFYKYSGTRLIRHTEGPAENVGSSVLSDLSQSMHKDCWMNVHGFMFSNKATRAAVSHVDLVFLCIYLTLDGD